MKIALVVLFLLSRLFSFSHGDRNVLFKNMDDSIKANSLSDKKMKEKETEAINGKINYIVEDAYVRVGKDLVLSLVMALRPFQVTSTIIPKINWIQLYTQTAKQNLVIILPGW